MEALPKDILEEIISFAVESPRDVSQIELISKVFLEIAAYGWDLICQKKFGKQLFESSLYMYHYSAKRQLQDDNRLGASRRIILNRPCYHRFNAVDSFYCCLVHAIQWDRTTKRVDLFIDVRGERDLRSPIGSTLHTPTKSAWGHSQVIGRPIAWRQQEDSMRSDEGVWEPVKVLLPPGHFQGRLSFSESSFFSKEGYDFCYSNLGIGFPDYEIVNLLPPFACLEDLFRHGEYVGRSSCPFESENNDDSVVQRTRWREFTPSLVWNRNSSRLGGNPSWFV